MASSFMIELDELTEPHKTLVQRIARSARRMNQMVSDVLDFTRTSFGDSIQVTREEMDVGRMVRDVVSEVSTRYPASSVKMEADGVLHGQWDCGRLTQALTNLVSNAVQHGEGAPITVEARGTAEEVLISVRNEGPPIPGESLKDIFKPGVQGGSDRRQDDPHLGLGLYIVERIVTAHGGRVDVASNKQSTTFTVHLPRAA